MEYNSFKFVTSLNFSIKRQCFFLARERTFWSIDLVPSEVNVNYTFNSYNKNYFLLYYTKYFERK
jgi:hypothetical protein